MPDPGVRRRRSKAKKATRKTTARKAARDAGRKESRQVGQRTHSPPGEGEEQSPNGASPGDPCGNEELVVGPQVVQMPLQGPGGMVGAVLGELRVTICDDAEAYDRMTVEERQQLWNETDGDQCVCGTWHQYGTHNGGWAAVAAVYGVHGCQNTSVSGSDFCLYCTEEPDQPCDQWGRVLSTQNLHVHPHRGHLIGHLSGCPAPTRCGDVWPGMVCPSCRHDGQQSCFMRCRCPCDGCSVGRVWYTPDNAELCTYEPPQSPYDDQGDMEEQAADMEDQGDVEDQDNFNSATGEGESGGPADRGGEGHPVLPITPVLCQLVSAQAGHHQFMSVVPATGGKDQEHQEDLEQSCTTSQQLRLAEMQPD